MTIRTHCAQWILLTVLIVGIVAGCAPATVPPSAAGDPVVTDTPTPEVEVAATEEGVEGGADWRDLCAELVDRSRESGEEEYDADFFVTNQVMVTGDPAQIDELVGIAAEQGMDFARINPDPIDEPIELPWFQTATERSDVLAEYFSSDDHPVVRLYAAEDSTVGAACVLLGLQQETGLRAYAELNYLIGPRPHPTEGSPFGYLKLGADASTFAEQEAFEDIGLDIGAQCRSEEREVYVGVFDTSPFTASTDVDAQPDPFTLTVADYVGTAQLPDPHQEAPLPPNAADHGLFVSALIHAVAADSHIELYRVLDDKSRGKDSTLVRALSDYIVMALGRGDGSLEGTVLNLSLGVHYPPYFWTDGSGNIIVDRLVMPLSILINMVGARALGAIVVSAAGNDATPAAMDVPPNFPARWADFAVAAVDGNGNRSCFSNDGNIAAPGGGATCDVWEIEDDSLCTASDCPYGIMSRMEASSTGYGWWGGTSFATALVSGVAARYLEAPAPDGSGFLDRDAVIAIMLGGATQSPADLSGGVIRITDVCPAE